MERWEVSSGSNLEKMPVQSDLFMPPSGGHLNFEGVT